MRYLSLILSGVLFYSCSLKKTEVQQTERAKFSWPTGHFITSDSAGVYNEFWKKINDSEYNGSGCYVLKERGDTAFSMKMRLDISPEKVSMYYFVVGQNEGREVEFKLTKQEGKNYIFENAFHNFPSIMEYKMYSDTLYEVEERGFDQHNKEKIIHYISHKVS